MTQIEFLRKIRENDGLKHAVLRKIEISESDRRCLFEVITDMPYTAQDEQAAQEAVREAVPPLFRGELKLIKLVADPQLIRHKILEYLNHSHRAAAACIRAEDITVTLGDPVQFMFGVDGAERGFFEKNEQLLSGVKGMLERNFCNVFEGKLVDKEKAGILDEETEEEEEPFDYRPARTFPVEGFETIDESNVPKNATYIADCDFTSDALTICGEVTFIQERTTKPKTDASGAVVKDGKPYLRFTVNDGTGMMSFSYFLRKRTEEKIREIKEGDWIAVTGENEMYGERLSFTGRYINRGHAPEGFVPEKRQGKAVPMHYSKVAPEELIDYSQMNLFDQSVMPEDLVKNTFVVFDLETTGLVNSPTGGKMDAITEIGAVKIIGGEIKEKFTTLVNPERKLDDEIVKLTGITDDMVKDAPKIAEVIPDFVKFCDGCLLVGHNVQFDYKFVRYYAEKEEYAFEFKTYDTMSLAQSMLFLSNYKLNTLADHYGISFNHHRAWDDALTTAKIFIELIKAKKCLPKA
ncbi:MAG: hypothetical protein DBX39_00905 [Bacillota bacterium]|nr:MAG: hypothetical protein DBX39_00905 [Bacillota bacterium]